MASMGRFLVGDPGGDAAFRLARVFLVVHLRPAADNRQPGAVMQNVAPRFKLNWVPRSGPEVRVAISMQV